VAAAQRGPAMPTPTPIGLTDQQLDAVIQGAALRRVVFVRRSSDQGLDVDLADSVACGGPPSAVRSFCAVSVDQAASRSSARLTAFMAGPPMIRRSSRATPSSTARFSFIRLEWL